MKIWCTFLCWANFKSKQKSTTLVFISCLLNLLLTVYRFFVPQRKLVPIFGRRSTLAFGISGFPFNAAEIKIRREWKERQRKTHQTPKQIPDINKANTMRRILNVSLSARVPREMSTYNVHRQVAPSNRACNYACLILTKFMREFSLQVCTSQANFWPCNTQRDLKHFTRIKASDGCFRGVFWGRFSRRTLELTLLLKLLLHPVHFRCEMPHKVRLQTSKAWVSWRIFTVSFRWSHFPLGPGKSHSLVEVLAKWKCELAEAQRDAGKANIKCECSVQRTNWKQMAQALHRIIFPRFRALFMPLTFRLRI